MAEGRGKRLTSSQVLELLYLSDDGSIHSDSDADPDYKDSGKSNSDSDSELETHSRRMNGETEDNRMNGETEDNRMNGKTEENRMDGEAEEDKMDGETEENVLNGETEKNTMDGEAEENTMDGEAEENTMDGETEENTMDGETEENTMDGETEENTMDGETEENTMDGETEETTMDGETESNNMVGETEPNRTDDETECMNRRKRQSNPGSWKKTLRKRKNTEGLEHLNSKGDVKAARAPKPVNCTRCRFKCNENFAEPQRLAVCQEYWQLGDFDRQKDFLLMRTNTYKVQRERPRGERKRQKRQTVAYSFLRENEKVRVCKNFFLKTLDISHGPVDYALQCKSEAGTFVGEDKRGRHTPPNKTSDDALQLVRKHIESFPVIESHYTRRDTHRKYLDQKLSIAKMYHLYEEQCNSSDPPVKKEIYRRTFCNEYNMSFFHPKKDQCQKCAKYKILNGDEKEAFEEEYRSHLKRKGESEEAKNADKMRASTEQNFVSATFDLQSVLQIPSSDVSIMY